MGQIKAKWDKWGISGKLAAYLLIFPTRNVSIKGSGSLKTHGTVHTILFPIFQEAFCRYSWIEALRADNMMFAD